MLLSRLGRPLTQAARTYSAQSAAAASASYKQALEHYPETKVTTLPNGLRVATEQTPHQTCTIGLYIDAGSRYENEKNNGTAHFLEHMAFKGTQKRTQQQIELEVENKGAHLNAYTSREQTVYYAKCFSKDADWAVDMLSDLLQNSTFNANQVEIERGVILREMQDVSNIPSEVVLDHLHSVAYQGHSLGRTILGPAENVNSITREDLKSFVDTHYTAPRIVLAAAGGVDHEEVVKMAQRFSGLSDADNTPAQPPAAFTGSEVRVRDDMLPEAHIAVSVEGVGWDHPDYYPLTIASTLVGNWDRASGAGANLSSALARSVAEHQLAHSYMSFHTSYKDTGLWGAYAVCDYNKVEDFVYELQQEWMHLVASVSDGEVARARNKLRASLLFALDGTTPVCDAIGQQMLAVGRRIHPAELEARIAEVDAAAVKKAATKYIFDKCPAVAGIGPIEGLPDYNRLRGQMHWMRV